MNCVDVNVLVYAHRADLDQHADYRLLLERLANGDEPLGLADAVVSATMRLSPGPRHWEMFRQLADDIDARGNDISDAYLAGYAMDNNAAGSGRTGGARRSGRRDRRRRCPVECYANRDKPLVGLRSAQRPILSWRVQRPAQDIPGTSVQDVGDSLPHDRRD